MRMALAGSNSETKETNFWVWSMNDLNSQQAFRYYATYDTTEVLEPLFGNLSTCTDIVYSV
jgi:hypothetical protein